MITCLTFAQGECVYRIISSIDELNTGDTVIIAVESGGDINRTMAIGKNGSKADITAYVQRHILLSPEQEDNLTFRVEKNGNYYNFVYQDANNLRYLGLNYNSYNSTCYTTGRLSADAYSNWELTYLTDSHRFKMYASYYLSFYYNTFFGSYSYEDQIAEQRNLHVQAGSPAIGNKGASAISVFKKHPHCYSLTYDFNGGECDASNEYGGSEALPQPTKQGATFYRWRNKSGQLFRAGERYPATGALTQDETLIAEYQNDNRDFVRSYTQVFDYHTIYDGDILLFLMEDGDNNPNPARYALYNQGTTTQLKTDENFVFTNEDEGFRFVATKASSVNTFDLFNTKSGYYIYPTTTTHITPCVASAATKANGQQTLFSPMNDEGHHFAISNMNSNNYGYAYLCYSSSNTTEHLIKYNYIQDQFALSVKYQTPKGYTLFAADSMGYHPSSWTIYKEEHTLVSQFVFQTDGKGKCALDTVMAIELVLPEVTDIADGLSFAGWSDGTTIYPANTLLNPNGEDIWLTAVYEPVTAHFIVNELLGEPVPNQIDTLICIPNCIAKESYRFLGWTLSPTASNPDAQIHIGDSVVISKSTYYYAVFEDLIYCNSFELVTDGKIENGAKYLLTFKDGGKGSAEYVIHINEYDGFSLLPFDREHPNSADIFTYTNNTFTNHDGKRLSISRNGGGWMNLVTNGGAFDNGYYTASNGAIRLQVYNNYNGVGTECLVYSSPTSVNLIRSAQTVDQLKNNMTLAAAIKSGKYPSEITVYKQLPNYAYYVEYSTGVANISIPRNESCAVTLPTDELFEEPWKAILIGWATTPEKAKAGITDAGVPGGYFVPTHDCTLYAVYRDVFYDILEWKPEGIVIQTMSKAMKLITQIIPNNRPIFNTLDDVAIDAGVYNVKTEPLYHYPGHILDLTFRDSSDQYIFTDIWVNIPYIIINDTTTEYFNRDTASWTDVVITSGSTLTVTSDMTFRHVMVMAGGKLIVPAGCTLRCRELSLRGGQLQDTTYRFRYPQLKLDGQVEIDNQTIWYDFLVSDRQFYNLALPVEVDRNAILSHLGDTIEKYIADYAGNLRAQAQTGWDYTKDMVLTPGKGYTCCAVPLSVSPRAAEYKQQKYIAVRFPMNVGESYSEQTEKSVPVSEYKSDFAPGFWNWNLIGNPYFTSFQGALYVDTVEQNYVTIPNDSGTVYVNRLTRWTELPAFNNFFIQTVGTGNLTFALRNRVGAPLFDNRPSSDWRTGLSLQSCALQTTDQVGILIGDCYSEAYEINADLQKWMNQGLNLYGVATERLAFIALNPTEAQSIKLGYQAPIEGSYTLMLDSMYDLSLLSSAVLYDTQTMQYTDLLQSSYTFTTNAGRDDERFVLSLTRHVNDVTTSMETIETNQAQKVLINGQLIIQKQNQWYNLQGNRIQ